MGERYTYHTSRSVFAGNDHGYDGAATGAAADSAVGFRPDFTSAFESHRTTSPSSGYRSTRSNGASDYAGSGSATSFGTATSSRSTASARRSSAHRGYASAGSASADYVYGNTARYAEPVTTPDVDFDVIRGHRRPEVETLPQSFHTFARVFLAVVVAISLIAFVRVGLSAASVNVNITSQTLASQIDDAQEQANSLEIQQSLLMNSSSLASKASELGMSAPASTTSITLPDDVVATDAQGNLSLSGSLTAMASQG